MFYSTHYKYRRYTLEDVPLLITLYRDWQWENVEEDFVKKHLENLIFKQYDHYNGGVLAVFEKNTDEYVGHCGIKCAEKTDEWLLSFRFLKSFWKNDQPLEPINACVKHGFGQLGIKEIIIDLDNKSKGAAKMIEKVNFKHRVTFSENTQIIHRYSIFNTIS
jgi:RimJ/RimL family protein N-acetyltransferase